METRLIGTNQRRNRTPFLAVSTMLLVTMGACGENEGAGGNPLEGSRWEMTSVREGNVLVGAHPTTIATIEFTDGRAFGSTGCNLYQFPYSVESDSVSFGEPAQTGSACHPDYVDQGDAFINAMQASTGVSLTDDNLELTDSTGVTQLVFRPASELPLVGVAWQLERYGSGTAPLAGTQISLMFRTDGRLEGIAGCNNYFADYQIDGNALTITAIAHTEKACIDPEGVMTQETDYLNALQNVEAFSTNLTGLELLDGGGIAVAAYRFGGRIR